MDKHTFLSNIDPNTIENLYHDYLSNPKSLTEEWQQFFKGFDFAMANFKGAFADNLDIEFRVLNLIDAYRKRGHLFTKTNPVRTRRKYSPTLEYKNFGLSETHLEQEFEAGKQIGVGKAKLSSIIEHLEATYCHSIGVEYLYIRDPEVVEWLRSRIESTKNRSVFTREEKKHTFFHINQAVSFEQFIHRKFVGQKRFSLEGIEALVPALDALIERGAEQEVEEVVIGMAHRGRLNVLANVMQKPWENIFNEFIAEGYEEDIALGDVKYHLGFNNTIKTHKGKSVRLNLVPNPSHLETVGPVAIGLSRALAETCCNSNFKRVVPVVIHGDAAIAGQGVVYETIQMSQLNGYKTGGTIHLVTNNQVGFTTNYLDARSSTYCTDIAKVIKAPIFHVNADDPDALIHTIRLAVDYRQTFHTDVFIDILGYRRYGHNEGDEPRFTQPTLYDAIANHPTVRELYSDKLISEGIIDQSYVKQAIADTNGVMEEKFELAKSMKKVRIQRFLSNLWENLRYSKDEDFENTPKTGVDNTSIAAIADSLCKLPEGHTFFKKLVKLVEERSAMVTSGRVDWALAELLAYGTLVSEGHPVRLSGQDSERGTFSHRHSVYSIKNSEEKYCPLKNISNGQAAFNVFNSPLSEYGVMGFEYGYTLATPNTLTIWEAQFGDFHNVAQVIIDQYISSAEDKWGLRSGLTLLLPHGFEGQGPEHSSARMERFLTLAARNNMQIANITTPANFFHALRRQVKREFRTPLVVFTPKSLLRHPLCISNLEEMQTGTAFQEVIDDSNVNNEKVLRVVFCSGKIYYDLLERKNELDARDLAIVRIEQLYPFPKKQVDAVLKLYPNAIKWLWVQEEPRNMGAWNFIRDQFGSIPIELVSRLASGSPAVGLSKLHFQEQEEIVGKVFRKCDCELKNKYCGLQCKVGGHKIERQSQHELL
jgi:2-oxoglutarate dehydrogenase E1 component